MNRGFEVVIDSMRKTQGDIVKPRRNDSRSAGYDFITPIDFTVEAGKEFMLWTDVKCYMKSEEWLFLDVRSSVPTGLRLNNTIGVIDSSYYNNPKNDGNVGFKFLNQSNVNISFQKGERIGQGIFLNYLITDDDSPINETRGSGFGSSGK